MSLGSLSTSRTAERETHEALEAPLPSDWTEHFDSSAADSACHHECKLCDEAQGSEFATSGPCLLLQCIYKGELLVMISASTDNI